MFNLIKAQKYQLTHNAIVLLVSVVLIALTLSNLTYLSPQSIRGTEPNGGIFAAISAENYIFIFLLLSCFFACYICGLDFNDKTINYELMAGHSRKSVFWSRVIVSLIVVLVGGLLLIVVPVGGVTLFLGWGKNITFSAVVLRFGLSLLALMRMSCFLIFLTFLIRNAYFAMVAGYMLNIFCLMGSLILSEIRSLDFELTYHLSLTNLMELLTFDNYKMGFIDGKDAMVFIADTEPSLIIGTVASSLIMSAVWLTLGYLVFRKRDIH